MPPKRERPSLRTPWARLCVDEEGWDPAGARPPETPMPPELSLPLAAVPRGDDGAALGLQEPHATAFPELVREVCSLLPGAEDEGPGAALFECPLLRGCPCGLWAPVRRSRASLGKAQGTQ